MIQDNNNFLQNPGEYFTGVNYLASNAGISMWKEWDEKVVEDDFKALAKYGTQVIRVFPIWSDFQPITMERKHCAPGGKPVRIMFNGKPMPDTALGRAGMDEVMMKRFERMAGLALKYGFKMIVPLITGHITFQLIVPPALEGMDAFSHPTSLKWQKKFISAFIDYFKGHEAIAAWEPGNECSCMSIAASVDQAWFWLSTITDTIRLHDNTRPILSGMHSLSLAELKNNKWLLEDQAELCDVLTPHPYPCWKQWANCDPCNTIRNTMHAVTEKHFYGDISQKPAFIEEIGTWGPVFSNPSTHAATLRNILWNSWAHDSRGLLWWCAFDQEELDSAPYNWEYPGLEHGIFTRDRKAHQSAEEILSFRKYIDDLPFDTLPEAEKEAVCILGGDTDHTPLAHGCMLLSQQAGINIQFQSSGQCLRDSELYLLPSAKARAGLSVKAWKELREKVASGSALYLSLDDTYLDRVSEIFGAEVVTREENSTSRKFMFELGRENVKLELCPPAYNRMHSLDSKVIGSSTDGNPVFFQGTYGKGKVFLLAFPIEKMLVGKKPGRIMMDQVAMPGKSTDILLKSAFPNASINESRSMTTVTLHPLTEREVVVVAVNNTPETVNEEFTIAHESGIAGEVLNAGADSGIDGKLALLLKKIVEQ